MDNFAIFLGACKCLTVANTVYELINLSSCRLVGRISSAVVSHVWVNLIMTPLHAFAKSRRPLVLDSITIIFSLEIWNTCGDNFNFIHACFIHRFRCNGTGHIARECAQSPDEPSCYNCNKTGHIARNCPEGGRDSNQTCYNCNKAGHISRNCPDGTKTCYVCGKPGHISRDCEESERN